MNEFFFTPPPVKLSGSIPTDCCAKLITYPEVRHSRTLQAGIQTSRRASPQSNLDARLRGHDNLLFP
jgi:hypothetical protein